MPQTEPTREEDLRRLLTDAIEVQIATLKAGIGFWSEWIDQTTAFVESATESLSKIKADRQQAKDVLLDLVDAGRASVRSMTELPRHTATRLIEELDKLEKKKAQESAAAPRGARRPTPHGRTSPRPKRAGRVKT